MTVEEVLRKSEMKLIDLHPYLRYLTVRLIKESFAAGVPIVITQGFRSTEYQNSLYAQGRTKPGPIVTNAKGGRSYHNYGLAVDFALLMPDGRTVSWDAARDGDKDGHKDWWEVIAIAERIGYEAGARWDHFVDLPHFQYTFGLPINTLQKGSKPALKPELANKAITNYLQPEWKAAHDKNDREGKQRAATIADALRVASGQEPQNK